MTHASERSQTQQCESEPLSRGVRGSSAAGRTLPRVLTAVAPERTAIQCRLFSNVRVALEGEPATTYSTAAELIRQTDARLYSSSPFAWTGSSISGRHTALQCA